jgi:hypothetical protein
MKLFLIGALLFAPAASAHVTGTEHSHDHVTVIELPIFCPAEDEQDYI